MLPPMPPIKNYPVSATSSAKPPLVTSSFARSSGSSSTTSSSSSSPSKSPSPPSAGSRVTVNTVVVRKPPPPRQPPVHTPSLSKRPVSLPVKRQHLPASHSDHAPLQVVSSSPAGKKDPMAALFMPKNRAFSQSSVSSRPTAR